MVSVVLATAGGSCTAWIAFWGSVKFFVYRYPHDPMNGLGALFVAIIALPLSWVILYMLLMRWQHVRAWRRQQGIS